LTQALTGLNCCVPDDKPTARADDVAGAKNYCTVKYQQ
jgi:hypothetical protein